MRARRVDANQNQVVRDLRRMGVTVAITSGVGNGFPDLVISGGHHTALVEIKDPTQPPSQRRLTAEEELFHFSWPGRIGIAHTAEEALAILTE